MATLTGYLRDLLVQARKHESVPQRRTLTNGLVLEVTQQPNGDVRLKLERPDVAPAQAEWATVLKHWPEQHSFSGVPNSTKAGRRYSLVGSWPRPAELPIFSMQEA